MASKKDKNKSSKTAHVLNLITTPAQRQSASSQSEGTPEEISPDVTAAAPAAPSRPLMPPVVEVANSQDDKIASQIRSALADELTQLADQTTAEPSSPAAPGPSPVAAAPEPKVAPVNAAAPNPTLEPIISTALEADLEQAAAPKTVAAPAAPEPVVPAIPEPAPEPVVSAVPEPSPEPAVPTVTEPEPVIPAAPEPEPVVSAALEAAPELVAAAPEPASAPVHTAPAPTPEALPSARSAPLPPEPPRGDFRGPAPTPQSGNDLLYVNIMQTIVESMAPRYIKMFGVCKCSRCAADVKALTLTNLAPKYAVFHRRDRIPMLTVYENRYGSLIAAQLTKACSIVKINPHHR